MIETAPAAQVTPLLVDAREAAALCGIGRTLWLQLASAGRVPMPVRLGRRTLWRAEELAEWVAAGCPARDRWTALREKPRGGT
jgi:predicted DNA-binding transcriptional regulator AlpA